MQDLLPDKDSIYSLGSSQFRFKDLYVSPGTIHIGDVALSTISGELFITNTNTNGTSTIQELTSMVETLQEENISIKSRLENIEYFMEQKGLL